MLALILLRSKNGKNKSEMIKQTIVDIEKVQIWQGVAVGTFLCRGTKCCLMVRHILYSQKKRKRKIDLEAVEVKVRNFSLDRTEIG